MRRTLLLLLVLLAGGAWLIAGAGDGLRREHVTAAGVPLDVVHPAAGGRRPGVVVAHGFSGSARLMAPFGDTLAARGYPVVLLDLAGHGANTHPLPDQTASTENSTEALQADLAAAVAYLRSMPDVDPARIALVGHSMGAGAVTRYSAAHPDVTATVAISLPSAVAASAERPARLLTVVGGLEFPGFREAATTVAAQRADRAVRVIPGVEHITVLYAPATHRETVAWLDQTFGGPLDSAAIPFPGRRLAGAALLGLAFLIGFHPLVARIGVARPATPRGTLRTRVTVTVVATVAAAVGAVTARLLPTTLLPLAIAGYVTVYAAVTGTILLLYDTRRARADNEAATSARGGNEAAGHDGIPDEAARNDGALDKAAGHDGALDETARHGGALDEAAGHGGVLDEAAGHGGVLDEAAGHGGVLDEAGGDDRSAGAGLGRGRLLLVLPYAAIAIAVPVHLGLTHALPVGDRWWLLLIIWAAFALFAYAAERVTGGDPIALLAVAAVFVVVLAAAAVTGLTHGFVVLVLFPLIGLLLWQTLWSFLLNRRSAPTWLTALTGALVVTWPLAVTLPLVG
ncbi:alpha/beta fold hydrolase [Actinoplanes sp. NPDC026670]|uniref:dienelactone hydrolase family protein n=1 Tax=Actinoplanes sp. NPDC026670 TaxID=3154700 RepID=UPI0033EDF014